MQCNEWTKNGQKGLNCCKNWGWGKQVDNKDGCGHKGIRNAGAACPHCPCLTGPGESHQIKKRDDGSQYS